MSALGVAIVIEVPIFTAFILDTLRRHRTALSEDRKAIGARLDTQDNALQLLLSQVTPPGQPTLQAILQQLHTDVEVIKVVQRTQGGGVVVQTGASPRAAGALPA